MMTKFLTRIVLGLALLASTATVARADCGEVWSSTVTPPGIAVLTDFQLFACLDTQNLTVTHGQTISLGGWAFECRSGLQPSTQRVGDIGVSVIRADSGVDYTGGVSAHVGGSPSARPDVRAAYGGSCPALGANAGFTVTVDQTLPPGAYVVMVLIDTFDYAGRSVIKVLARTITVGA